VKGSFKKKAVDKSKQLLLCENCKETFGNKPFVKLDSNGYYGEVFDFCSEECFLKYINNLLHDTIDTVTHRKYSELIHSIRRCNDVLLAHAYGESGRLTSLQNSLAEIKQISIPI
jgi:hypothetical protein